MPRFVGNHKRTALLQAFLTVPWAVSAPPCTARGPCPRAHPPAVLLSANPPRPASHPPTAPRGRTDLTTGRSNTLMPLPCGSRRRQQRPGQQQAAISRPRAQRATPSSRHEKSTKRRVPPAPTPTEARRAGTRPFAWICQRTVVIPGMSTPERAACFILLRATRLGSQ